MRSIFIFFSLCILTLPIGARTFIDTQGRKVNATIIDVKDGNVELKLDGSGKIFNFPISKLCRADRDYIGSWQKDQNPEASAPPTQVKPTELDALVLDRSLWKMSTSSFEKRYKPNGFVYMSASKKDLRTAKKGLTLFGKKSGEVVVRSDGGLISSVSISLYNRGDHGQIPMAAFNEAYNGMIKNLNQKTGVRPEDKSTKGTVQMGRQLWDWGGNLILLEKSLSSDGKYPDFLRLRIKSKSASSAGMATRSSLKGNLVKDKNSGDVFIKNVPMVDQGQKGYCAVASAARVYQYYGLDVDQHELAQIAGTGARSGTSLGEMVAALKKVTRHVRSRVLVMYEYPKGLADKTPDAKSSNQSYDRIIRNYNMGLKEFARDVKNYNRIAKKKGKDEFPCDANTGVVHQQLFAMRCDPEIYREVMVKKSSFGRFQSKIEEYIDQGLPVGWCLDLGMFKEKDLPQMSGGHMRLIIGYNKKTKEIIYTDSWGNGHGKKRMPVADAFCMSTALLSLPPTK